jgi:hypothetical protein
VTNLQLAIVALIFFAANSGARADSDATRQASTSIVFTDVGKYLQTHGTIHVALEVDYQFMQQHCNKLLASINETKTFTSNSTNRYARTLHRNIRHTCADVEQLSSHPTTDDQRYPRHETSSHDGHERSPRQLAVALVAVTSIFSLYEAHRVQGLVENIKSNAQHQSTVIRHLSSRIDQLATRNAEVDKDLAMVLELETSIVSNLTAISWLQQRSALVDEFASDVNRGYDVLQELRRGRISPLLVDKLQAQRLLTRIRSAAQQLGGQPIIDHEEDLYQLPVSVVSTAPYLYTVLIHVGVAKEIRRLYRYHPSPIVLRQDNQQVALLVEPRRRLLVHNQNTHQELEEADLNACQKRSNTYVCEGPSAFHTQLRRSCLGALWANDLSSVQEHCPVQQTNVSWTAQSLGSDRVAVYFQEKTSLQILCPGADRRLTSLQGHHVLDLPANCSMTGMDLRINARSDVLLQAPVATHPQWDTAELLDGRTPAEILTIRAHLEQRRVQPAAEVRRMLQQQEAELRELDDTDQAATHHYGLYAVAAVVLVTTAAVLYRYGRLYWASAKHFIELKSLSRAAAPGGGSD